MKVGESVGNYMVKVMGAGSNCTYIMDVTIPGKKTRYFNALEALLDHFRVRVGNHLDSSALPAAAYCPTVDSCRLELTTLSVGHHVLCMAVLA